MFKDSCFGHFLSVSECLDVQLTLLHQLIRRQVNNNDSDNAIYFSICNNQVRFSVVDFALITGLKCHGVTESAVREQSSAVIGVRERYFKGMKSIRRQDIEVVLNAQSPIEDEKDVGILQLCLIYFVSNVLLSANKENFVADLYFQLVNDMDNFNLYDWGSVTWFKTRESIRNTGLIIRAAEKANKEPNYNLYGFPIVLQIWSYEVLPSLAARFAAPIKARAPRLCAWKTVQKPSGKVLMELVFGKSKVFLKNRVWYVIACHRIL